MRSRLVVVPLILGSAALSAAAPASASTRPSAELTIPVPAVNAGASPRVTFAVHHRARATALLQKQQGTRHVWTTVARLHPDRHGKGGATAPRVQQGVSVYRVALIRRHGKRRRLVAKSSGVKVYAFAPVALSTIAKKGTAVTDVNGQPFRYAIAILATETDSGVRDTPGYDTLIPMDHTTCRSISLTVAAPTENAGEAGGNLSVSVVQENRDPATINLMGNQIAPLTAPLTGRAWAIHASTITRADGPAGPHDLDFAANGTLSCYTPSGT